MSGSSKRLNWRMAKAATAISAAIATIGATTTPDRLICGYDNIEDMVLLPDTRWIVGSGLGDRFFQGGGLHLIDEDGYIVSKAALKIPRNARARAPYEECPGPPDLAVFSAHGLSLKDNGNGTYDLFVVNHGGRESIEVFTIEQTNGAPEFAWSGCVPTPRNAMSNSVAVRPDGSLVMSATTVADGPIPSFHEMAMEAAEGGKLVASNDDSVAMQKGAVFTWSGSEGWRKLPGSELLGNNGIELSRDGSWAYVNSWPGESVTRMPLDPAPGEMRTIELGFKPDNIRWSWDGKLVATGHLADVGDVMKCAFGEAVDCALDYRAAEIDPETLAVTTLFEGKGTKDFGTATIGLKTKKALWLGSVRSQCIAAVVIR